MDSAPDARTSVVRNGTVAILALCSAVALAATASTDLSDFLARATDIGALASALLFLAACVLIFFLPRLGYAISLVAGMIGLWSFRVQILREPWNPWIALNYSAELYIPSSKVLLFAKLELLSITLMVVTTACTAIRLLPARFVLGKFPLPQRTWPALALSFALLAAWFVRSVTPYRVPLIVDAGPLEFRILHVQKRGLRLDETAIFVRRNAAFAVTRTHRRLFQYEFPSSRAAGTLPQKVQDRGNALVNSPELLKLHTPPASTLLSWNAEGWYIVVKESRLFAFSTESGLTAPQPVIDTFREIEQLPTGQERSRAVRDVCMGFCYGPAAALGLVYANQPWFRLATSTSLDQ